jgi:hypothetical protein
LQSLPDRPAIFAKDPSVWDRVDKAISTNALNVWNPPPSPKTDAIYKELKGMQVGETRETFANMDLNQYHGDVPAHQFKELQDDQAAIRKNDAADAAVAE